MSGVQLELISRKCCRLANLALLVCTTVGNLTEACQKHLKKRLHVLQTSYLRVFSKVRLSLIRYPIIPDMLGSTSFANRYSNKGQQNTAQKRASTRWKCPRQKHPIRASAWPLRPGHPVGGSRSKRSPLGWAYGEPLSGSWPCQLVRSTTQAGGRGGVSRAVGLLRAQGPGRHLFAGNVAQRFD